MTPNNPEKGKQTGQGNAPVEKYTWYDGKHIRTTEITAGYAPPMEREITARDQWMQWQAKYPFTLDKVDRFLLALERNGIRPTDCFIANPDDIAGCHDMTSELTVHGYNDVRICGETDMDDGDRLTVMSSENIELQAYHRGFNVWVVVPTSQQSRALMSALVEATKEEEAK